MTTPSPGPADELLSILEEDSPAPEECHPHDGERLPLDAVVARVHELGVDPAMPERFRRLVGYERGPADRLLSLVDEGDDPAPGGAEHGPLPDVVAALERLGVDHAGGIERLRETFGRAAEAERGGAEGRRAAQGERPRLYDGAVLVHVEGSRRVYDAGEPIRLRSHKVGAAVTVTGEDGLPLAAFALPEAGGVELEHPGPPRVTLSVRGGKGVVRREMAAGDLALFDDAPWLRCHWIVALVLAVGWAIVGAQVMLIETVRGAFASPGYVYAIATYLLGTIPGALLFGWLADRYGRKPVYTATALVYVATGFATALLPPDLYGFTALRFLAGAATGGEYAVLNTSVQELMPKRRRGWACLAINGAFWLGLAAVELISTTPDGAEAAAADRWQVTFWTVGVLGAVLLGLRWFLPESPRWLVAHCRKDRQTDSMLDEIRRDRASRPERPAAAGLRLMVPVRVPGPSLALAGLMWGRYRRQMLVCLALICSQAFFYNAFSFRFSARLEALYGGVEGPIAGDHLDYYIAAANFAGPLLLGWWFDKAGRKPMISGSYMVTGCLLLWISALLLLGYLPRSSTQMAMAWAVVFFFASTAASSAYLTLGESFPAEVRATAFSLLFGAGMLVGVVGSLLYGWLTGDLRYAQDAPRHAWDVQQHEVAALGVLGILAGVAMAAAAVVEKAIGTEYALSSLEEKAPSLSQVDGIGPSVPAADGRRPG